MTVDEWTNLKPPNSFPLHMKIKSQFLMMAYRALHDLASANVRTSLLTILSMLHSEWSLRCRHARLLLL